MTTPNTPLWLQPSAPGQLSNNYGETAAYGSPLAGTNAALAGSTNLLAGTYTWGYTYKNRKGESILSATSSQVLTAGQQLQMTTHNPTPISVWSVSFYLTAAPVGVNLGFLVNLENSGTSVVTYTLIDKTKGNGVSAPGVDTSGDLITLKARYTNPNGSDLPSSVRFQAVKNVMQGSKVVPQTVWDSDWLGNPATTPFPTFDHQPIGPNCVAPVYGVNGVQAVNRVYVAVQLTDGNFQNYAAAILSAPINGGSVGSWRYENPVSVTGTTSTQDEPSGLVAINGRLYCGTTGGIWMCQINTFDGSLGPWTLLYTFPSFGNPTGTSMGGFDEGAFSMRAGSVNFLPNSIGQGCLIFAIPNGTTAMLVQGFQINPADGTIQSGPNSFPNMAIFRAYAAVWCASIGNIYIIGGTDNGGTPQPTVQYIGYNDVTGAQGGVSPTVWTAAANLPIARARFAFCNDSWFMAPDGEWGTCFVMGGWGGGDTTSAPSNKVYYIDANTLQTNTNVWHLATHTLSVPVYGGGGVMLGKQQFNQTFPNDGPINGYIGVISGLNLAFNIDVFPQVQISTRPDAIDAVWFSGSASVLGAGSLGTGGAVTQNGDGSVDVTVVYNAVGSAFANGQVSGAGAGGDIRALFDGDQVQLNAIFTDQTNGDPSPVGSTILAIGQPPQIQNVSPANAATPATANPPVSFGYSSGAGGQSELWWRATITAAGVTYYDTGKQYNVLNAITAAQLQAAIAPMLASGTTYTLTITVQSKDVSYDGVSVTSATSTTTFTPTLAVPQVPTGLTVTPIPILAAIRAAATTPAAGNVPTFSRLYQRPSSVVAEAESSTLIGLSSSNNHLNFTGTGFVPLLGPVGNAIMPPPVNQKASSITVVVRYANSSGGTKTASLYVNGQKVQLSFPVTANWDTWSTISQTYQIAANVYTISLQVDPTDTNNINIDSITAQFPWTMLKDNIASVGLNVSINQLQLDQVALNTLYDFAVSSCNAQGEGPMTAAVTGVALNTPGGASGGVGVNYDAVLHLAGQSSLILPLVTPLTQPVSRTIDAQQVQAMGDTAPKTLYGIFNYRTVPLHCYVDTQLKRDVLNQIIASAMQGNLIYYRDATGLMVVCTLLDAPKETFELPTIGYIDIDLVETPFTYAA